MLARSSGREAEPALALLHPRLHVEGVADVREEVPHRRSLCDEDRDDDNRNQRQDQRVLDHPLPTLTRAAATPGDRRSVRFSLDGIREWHFCGCTIQRTTPPERSTLGATVLRSRAGLGELGAALELAKRVVANRRRERFRVVLRLVSKAPAGVEVPPAPPIRGGAVDDCEAEVGRSQAGGPESRQNARG